MVNFFRILDSDRHAFFCPMNFVADTYMGCPHGCWYCYAPSYAARFKKYRESFSLFRNFRPRLKSQRDLEKIEKAIETGDVKGTCDEKQENLVGSAIKHKHPLRVGSVSEPFGLPLESEQQTTYKVLEILIANDYPFVVCTKSPLVAHPKYVNLLKSTKKDAVQISLISRDENLLQWLETSEKGKTPSSEARLDALKTLSSQGIFTTCRIQPVIPQVTEQGMRQLIYALAEAGVNHVIFEFLWFPTGHAEDMSSRLKAALDAYVKSGGAVGEDLRRHDNDLYSFYRSFEDSSRGYGRIFFSKKQIASAMARFAQFVNEANKEFGVNMTFGSGNEETTYLNSTDNCCGVDRLQGFVEGTPCTVHTLMKIARQKGRVTLGDLKNCYNPCMDKIAKLWIKKGKDGYFLEGRVFKLKGKATDSQVDYVYDENAVPR